MAERRLRGVLVCTYVCDIVHGIVSVLNATLCQTFAVNAFLIDYIALIIYIVYKIFIIIDF